MSEGRQKLLQVLNRTTVRYLAARCQVSQNAVYNWVSGRHSPKDLQKKYLFQIYDIPLESWNSYTGE
jgi:hypothetical protein